MRLSGLLIEKDGEHLIWSSVEDISKRKEIEAELKTYRNHLEEMVKKRTAELQASKEKLKEAQQIAHLGQWELNIANNTLQWSDEIYRIFGIDPQVFGASYEAFLDAIYPEDREYVNKAYTDSLNNKEPYNIIHRLLLNDGTLKYVNEICRTEYNAKGDPIRSLGAVQDITDRILIEEELRRANERLQELDKLKSMFIATMSHELRTPLNPIIGFSGMMLQGLSGELNEEQTNYLDRVNRAGKHLLELISDIIDISKIEAGRVDIIPEWFTLEEVVDEAVDTIRLQLNGKGLELVLNVDSLTWPEIYTDRRRLFQCLLNYLTNAVKYTENGKINIIIKIIGDEIDIAVHDTGIGIKEEEFPRLFEAFERLDSHLRIKAGGTGLGLYLTKEIITELLQGNISVKSQYGQGSVFSLRIPKVINLPRKETKESDNDARIIY